MLMIKSAPHSKPTSCYIPVHQLTPGQFQPREYFNEQDLQELAASLKTTQGVLQPLIVRPLTSDYYEIIAGERRWRAAQLAGLEEIHCLITEYTDTQALEAAIIENINRADLNPIEEARAYQNMIDNFGYSHEKISKTVGKSREKITNTLRLLKLNKYVQDILIKQDISEGHGKILASLPEPKQYELAQKCVIHNWNVRQLEKAVREINTQKYHPENQKPPDPNITSLENNLEKYLGCPVTIDFNNTQKRVCIEFYNLDILEGILKKIGFNKP